MNKTILVIGEVTEVQYNPRCRRLLRMSHTPIVERHSFEELLDDAIAAASGTVTCHFDTLIIDRHGWETWTTHANFPVHFRQLYEQNPESIFLVAHGNRCSQLPGFLRDDFLSMTE